MILLWPVFGKQVAVRAQNIPQGTGSEHQPPYLSAAGDIPECKERFFGCGYAVHCQESRFGGKRHPTDRRAAGVNGLYQAARVRVVQIYETPIHVFSRGDQPIIRA